MKVSFVGTVEEATRHPGHRAYVEHRTINEVPRDMPPPMRNVLTVDLHERGRFDILVTDELLFLVFDSMKAYRSAPVVTLTIDIPAPPAPAYRPTAWERVWCSP